MKNGSTNTSLVAELIEQPSRSNHKKHNSDSDMWIKQGQQHKLLQKATFKRKLDPGVYKVLEDRNTGELYLMLVSNKFDLPNPLYGHDPIFTQRVIHTYSKTNSNFGVLLSGLRGTGKTVTGQAIANLANLPVLLFNERFDQTADFINSIPQDIVVFFDEYEKIYNHYEHSILSVMDGVLTTKHRRLFILTTNDMYVNPNMLQRPSRLRYVKQYNDLPLEVITEIVNDLLINKSYHDQIIQYLSTLESITVDIVKAVVEEVNIHNQPPSEFADIFNTKVQDSTKNIYLIQVDPKTGANTEKLLTTTDQLNITKFGPSSINKVLEVNGYDVGRIVNVQRDIITLTDIVAHNQLLPDFDLPNNNNQPSYLSNSKQVLPVQQQQQHVVLRISSVNYTHPSFGYGGSLPV